MANEEKNGPHPGTLIGFFRLVRGWNQTQLARESGVDKGQISRYEAGDEVPRPATFERLRRAAGVPSGLLDFIRRCIRIVREAMASGAAGAWTDGPRDAPADQVLGAVDRALTQARAELALLRSGRPADRPAPPTEADFERVEALWSKIKDRPDRTRRLLAEESGTYRDWLLCLRLCEESAKATAADPRQALGLADFAVFVARRVPGTEAWRSRLEGYCTRFLADAHRASGDLPAADAACDRARRLWDAGEDEAGLLPEGPKLVPRGRG